MTLTVKLTNYPLIAVITKSFTITITCTVTSMSFLTYPQVLPTLHEIEVGVTTQPYNMDYSIVKTPNCLQDPTWTLTTANAFTVNTGNADGESGKVQVTGATLSHLGTYPMTLTATLDGVTVSTSFTIVIKDPCKRAIFITSPYPVID